MRAWRAGASVALALAASQALAAPDPAPATPAKAATPTPASHGPPLAGGPPAARRDPCDRLDAAETPACADAAQRRALRAATPPPRQPAVAPAPAAKAVPPRAAVAAAKPKAKPAPKTDAMTALSAGLTKNPILAGAAAGGLVLLAGLGAWAALARPRAGAAPRDRPKSSPPTPYRRDLVLIDDAGQGRRLAGQALSPFAWVGGHARDQLRLEGDGVAARHVQVWVQDGRLMVRKAAPEPVFLNDRLLKDATAEVVSTGDRLQLGRAGFRVFLD